VSSQEDRPRTWRTEPEPTAATGGHLAPGVESTPAFLDPLFDPLPGQKEPPPAPDRSLRPADALDDDFFGPPEPRRRRRPGRPRPVIRRVKRTVKRVDPFSVLKLSLFYYSCFLIVWLLIVAVIYWILQGLGLFEIVQDVAQGMEFENWKDFSLSLLTVERWAFVIGLVLVLVGSIVNAFLAFLYNVAADVVGGLEVTFVERDM
jgi:Transmembrane domain of unknown function (DUF3566)